jgi:hypothetical protein
MAWKTGSAVAGWPVEAGGPRGGLTTLGGGECTARGGERLRSSGPRE